MCETEEKLPPVKKPEYRLMRVLSLVGVCLAGVAYGMSDTELETLKPIINTMSGLCLGFAWGYLRRYKQDLLARNEALVQSIFRSRDYLMDQARRRSENPGAQSNPLSENL